MKVVILAAGLGSRLGKPHPKCLTEIKEGKSILDIQLQGLKQYINDIYMVVGYKKEMIMEAHPELFYIYNTCYDITNTSKSLLKAISKLDDDVLWLNGDVVFEESMIQQLLSHRQHSFMAVNTGKVGEEEVKYTLDQWGYINDVSKKVEHPLGEAIGINFIRKEDRPGFVNGLKRCCDNDYFEKGLEYAIADGLKLKAVDVSDYHCIEVDFKEDLMHARQLVGV